MYNSKIVDKKVILCVHTVCSSDRVGTVYNKCSQISRYVPTGYSSQYLVRTLILSCIKILSLRLEVMQASGLTRHPYRAFISCTLAQNVYSSSKK